MDDTCTTFRELISNKENKRLLIELDGCCRKTISDSGGGLKPSREYPYQCKSLLNQIRIWCWNPKKHEDLMIRLISRRVTSDV